MICTLQGTNISPQNGILKMIFLFPRWDMLVPWRVHTFVGVYTITFPRFKSFFSQRLTPGEGWPSGLMQSSLPETHLPPSLLSLCVPWTVFFFVEKTFLNVMEKKWGWSQTWGSREALNKRGVFFDRKLTSQGFLLGCPRKLVTAWLVNGL